MKLRTIFELKARSEAGLPDRRNALATIENVQRVMRSRMPGPKGFG